MKYLHIIIIDKHMSNHSYIKINKGRGGAMKEAFCLEIENLNCAHCAGKIEERLKKEPNVSDLELNFMLKKLKFNMDTQMSEAEVIEHMSRIADGIEKGVNFKSNGETHKSFEFRIENLDCGHCASKIEARLKQETNIKNLELNFMRKKLSFQMDTQMNAKEVGEYIRIIGDEIEKGIKFIPEGEEEAEVEQSTKTGKGRNKEAILMGISIALLIGGALTDFNPLFIVAYILVGYDVILQAGRNLIKGRMLDENFLMTIATIAAFAIGQYPEAVAVMLFYKIGEYMQGRAVDYSTREIEKAMDIRPEFARVIRGGEKIVSPKEVRIGEIIEVRPGEKVPLDGEIIEGKGTLDTSMLTGESLPSYVSAGDKVLSGSINKDGIIKIKVTTGFKDSTVSKILDLIQNASSKKSKSENFITKFARWYTPIVVGLAIFTAIVPSIVTGDYRTWIYNSIVFLVISCPCALVVSVPLGFFAGIGAASKAQILVKGSNYLEELNHIDTIVLDKTGTITKGQFGVTQIITNGVSKEALLEVATIIESGSNHPIAKSVVNAYSGELPKVNFEEFKEISGAGLLAKVDGKTLLAGNDKLMKQFNINYVPTAEIGSHIYVAQDDVYLGCIVVADEIKEDSAEAIRKLKAQGIKKVVMLTGDKKEIAESIGAKVGVDEVCSELLPSDKVEKVEALLGTHRVAFVGDGINDAPVLARADIGIAMGGVGSDAAIEASDVVLMTDRLTSISDVLKVAKRTRTIVTQNIVFALGVKVIVLILGILGIANMWLAIFADVGVSLIAVMNSIRILGKDFRHMFKVMK